MWSDNGQPPIEPETVVTDDREPPQLRKTLEHEYVDQCERDLGEERVQKLVEIFGDLDTAILTLRDYIDPSQAEQVSAVLKALEVAGVRRVGENVPEGVNESDPDAFFEKLGKAYNRKTE